MMLISCIFPLFPMGQSHGPWASPRPCPGGVSRLGADSSGAALRRRSARFAGRDASRGDRSSVRHGSAAKPRENPWLREKWKFNIVKNHFNQPVMGRCSADLSDKMEQTETLIRGNWWGFWGCSEGLLRHFRIWPYLAPPEVWIPSHHQDMASAYELEEHRSNLLGLRPTNHGECQTIGRCHRSLACFLMPYLTWKKDGQRCSRNMFQVPIYLPLLTSFGCVLKWAISPIMAIK